MKPKCEPKHVLLDIEYNQTIILPQQTAAKILVLLEEAESLEHSWNDDSCKILPNINFTLKNISNEKILGIKKAHLMGITYKEYLDIQKEKTDGNDQGSGVS